MANLTFSYRLNVKIRQTKHLKHFHQKVLVRAIFVSILTMSINIQQQKIKLVRFLNLWFLRTLVVIITMLRAYFK